MCEIRFTITLNLVAKKKEKMWQRKLVPCDLSIKKIKIGIWCFIGCIDFQQKWKTTVIFGIHSFASCEIVVLNFNVLLFCCYYKDIERNYCTEFLFLISNRLIILKESYMVCIKHEHAVAKRITNYYYCTEIFYMIAFCLS